MTRGILYIASGEKFFDEAVTAARRVKVLMPDIPIKIVTDSGKTDSVFDEQERIDEPGPDFSDKVRFIDHTPFEKTLFLDTDTHVLAPLYDLFELLDAYPIAAAHDPNRRTGTRSDQGKVELDGPPDCFSEFNTGVMPFRMDGAMPDFIALWRERYRTYRQTRIAKRWSDQPAFAEAVYQMKLPCYVLPPEYNLRFIYPCFMNGAIKVLHGRQGIASDEDFAKSMNQITRQRVFVPKIGKLFD